MGAGWMIFWIWDLAWRIGVITLLVRFYFCAGSGLESFASIMKLRNG